MTENQKLRDALQEYVDAFTAPFPPESAGLKAQSDWAARRGNAERLIRRALALPTADHIPDAGEKVADHLPNAGKMTNGLTQAETDASASVSGLTAAPVGERADFDGWFADRYPNTEDRQSEFRMTSVRDLMFEAWNIAFGQGCVHGEGQARAALSAGDAVDGVPGVETVAWMFTDPPMMGGRTEFRTDPENVTPHWTPLSATAVVKQYKEDAQRYRWLREQSDDDFVFAVVKNPHFDVYESPEELDAAIDAAMRKGQL